MTGFDVAIVGAGPAGSATAITLAQQGYQVALIDRALFPHDKLCGDFLSPINWPVLQELHVGQDLLSRPHAKIVTFRMTAADGTEAVSPLPTARQRQPGLGLRRFHLDDVLLERAKNVGACVHQSVNVTGIEKDSRGWRLDLDRRGEPMSVGAKLVVGADGRNSWVARRFGVATAQPSGSVGFEIQLQQVFALRDSVEIHQFPGGYAGIVRVDENSVNIGFTVRQPLLGRSVSFEQLREKFLSRNPFLNALLSSCEPVSALRSAWPVYFAARRCFGDGFVLAGDAARVTEPVTGEGIYLALRSGQLVAATLASALREGNFGSNHLRGYDRACRNEFGARLRLNALIRFLMYRPKLLSIAIRCLGSRKLLLESLVNKVCLPRAAFDL